MNVIRLMANTGFNLHLIEPLSFDSEGLPAPAMDSIDPAMRLRVPMLRNNRSLNLSNSVAIVAYEAWRQLGFSGGS